MRRHFSCGRLPSAILAREISAMRADRAFPAFRLASLANRLPMLFQQQIGPHPRVKLLRNLLLDQRLCLAIGDSVIFSLQSQLNSHQHLWDNSRPQPRLAQPCRTAEFDPLPDRRFQETSSASCGHPRYAPRAHCAYRHQIHSLRARQSAAAASLVLPGPCRPPSTPGPALPASPQSICRGSNPTSLLSAFHPRVQVASLAGYPQCHQIRNSYGSTGQHRLLRPVERLQLVENRGNVQRLQISHTPPCSEHQSESATL